MYKKKHICVYSFLTTFCFLSLLANQTSAENNPTNSLSSGQTIPTEHFLSSLPEPNTPEWETYRQTLKDKLIKKEFTLDTWKKQTEVYFEENTFTPAHIQLWDTIIHQTPEFQSDLLMYATVYALQALIKEVSKPNPFPPAISLSSQFLLKSIDTLKETQIIQLAEMADTELKKNPVRLEQLWNIFLQQITSTGEIPAPLTVAPKYEAVIYLCMTLTVFLPPNKFMDAVQLPEPMKDFFKDYKILIFDGGVLTEAHYHSLRSIFSCFPPKLHNIRMIIIPERVGISATQLFIPLQYGIVTDIPFLPMEVISNPNEFPVRYGTQSAPEFSMQVTVQIIRAIQFVQFRLRPELLLRRNALLINAKGRNYNFTRPAIRPEIYFNNPDELLPLSSYLWILNSEKVLQMAGDLLKIRQYFPTDVYLLLADILSEGKNTTLTFYMDETGYLTVREAPVMRAPIDEGYPAIITILPERFPPSFSIKETTSGYGSGTVDLQNISIQQNSSFTSGFTTPGQSNLPNPANTNISIETKGN